MADKKRMAGDALYGGEKDYGSWGDKWDSEATQQQLKASGAYSADSDLAKQFEGLNQDGKSRVDNEGGWRELTFDEDAKSAGNYADLVNKWSAAGFDVRAIDMDKGFANSNIAVRRSTGEGTGVEDIFDGKEPTNLTQSSGNTGDVDMSAGGSGGSAPSLGAPGRGGFGGSQNQQVFQDNDIVSNVTGDNNTVTNTQDNSIRQNMGSSDYASRYARGLKDKYVLNLINR